MSTTEEIAENLEQTRLLIEREPSAIVITRLPPDVDDGAGGKRRGGPPITLEPQTCFVSGVTRDSDYRQSSFATAESGESFTNIIIIIGLPGFDINQYDRFMLKGYEVEVTFRHPDSEYQVKAEGKRVTGGGR